jgi:hypothetical protein
MIKLPPLVVHFKRPLCGYYYALGESFSGQRILRKPPNFRTVQSHNYNWDEIDS